MTDKLISDLTEIAAPLGDNDQIEVQRSGQTASEHSLMSDLKTYIQSWLTKGMVGLGNVSNSLQLVAASNLSDVANVLASRANLSVTSTFKKYVAGRYYLPPGFFGGSSVAVTANRLYLVPFIAPSTMTISEFHLRVTAGSAGNWYAGIYAADVATLMPTGTVLVRNNAGGSTTTGSTNVTAAVNSNYQLVEGALYWLAVSVDNGTATFPQLLAGSGVAASLIGDSTVANINIGGGAILQGYYTPVTAGTWTDLTSAAFTAFGTGIVPVVGFKCVSVP